MRKKCKGAELCIFSSEDGIAVFVLCFCMDKYEMNIYITFGTIHGHGLGYYAAVIKIHYLICHQKMLK